MTTTKQMIPAKRVRDLTAVLHELRGLHEELLRLSQRKMSAMKEAKIDLMGEIEGQQSAVVRKISEREGFRKQWMETIACHVNLAPKAARGLRLSQITSFVAAEQESILREAADALQKAIRNVEAQNKLVARSAGAILSHLAWVMSASRPRAESPVTYTPDGLQQAASGSALLEAIG